MSLVIEPMPDLGITRVSRWIFNCYVIHDGDDGPVIVDAGLLPHPRRRRTGFERAVRVAVGDRRDTRPQRPRRRGRIAGRTTRCTDLPARIRTVEFTFTTPAVDACVRTATQQLGEQMTIGIGTVLTTSQATRAVEAGASFLVTPCLRPDVTAVATDRDVPVLMGAMTPGEVLTAHEAGATAVKIFPAGTLGAEYLSDLHGPFPDIRLVPSGGISAANATDYLAHGAAAVTAGTSVVTPALVSDGQWAEITARAAEFVTSIGKP